MLGIKAAPADAAQSFLVLPQNWDAVRVFLACQTQWRVAPMGGLSGLDYTSVSRVMDWMGIDDQAEAFEGLQVMEIVVLEQSRKALTANMKR